MKHTPGVIITPNRQNLVIKEDMMRSFEDLIQDQAKRYAEFTPQDACKAVFQEVLGPGHMIADEGAAEAYIRQELASVLPASSTELVELLGGRFFRLHLGALKCSGLSVRTLTRMLLLSTKMETGDRVELEAGTEAIVRLAGEGKLGFSADEAREYIDSWRADGYPICHHSERFREKYAPTYRVIAGQMAALLPLFCRLDGRLREGKRTILAIDGMSGAGKSSLAQILKDVYGCAVFHADDYFPRAEQRTPERMRQPGGNLDRERLRDEILEPLASGAEEITFRPFDCHSMTLCEPQTVSVGKLAIVEGSYCMHPELRRYYTDTVFLRVSPQRQRERIIERNDDMADEFFSKWIPMENTYIESTQVQRQCEFLLAAADIEMRLRQE